MIPVADKEKQITMIESKTNLKIKWFYESDDEDMEEAGEDYQAIISLPFKMIEVEEI